MFIYPYNHKAKPDMTLNNISVTKLRTLGGRIGWRFYN